MGFGSIQTELDLEIEMEIEIERGDFNSHFNNL